MIEECSKYGGVLHISIDENAPEGCIYIKCQSVSVAMATMAGLNGRYFAGKVCASNSNKSNMSIVILLVYCRFSFKKIFSFV